MRLLSLSSPFRAAALLYALIWLVCPASLQAQSPPQPTPAVRALLDKGEAEAKQGRREEAVRLYEQALQQAREGKDRPGEAAALTALGRRVLFQAPPKAMAYLAEALAIFQEIKDRRGQADCLLNLGNGAEITSQPQKALEYFESARQIYEEQGVKTGVSAALAGIGLIYRKTGQPRKSLEYLLPALAINQEAGRKDYVLIDFINLAPVYGDMADWPRALEMMEKARALAHELGDKMREGLILANLGIAQRRLGDSRQALSYLQQGLPLLEASGNKRTIATAFTNIATCYQDQGDLLKALDYMNRALDMHLEVNDRSNAAADLANLGNFYDNVGQSQNALEFYRRALTLSQETGDVFSEMEILNNIADTYDDLGQPDKARACYEQSLRLNAKAENKRIKAHTLYFLSSSWLRTGHPREALTFCEQALPLYQETGDSRGEARAELWIGGIKAQLGQFPEAQAHYTRALKGFQRIGDVPGEAATVTALAEIEERQNQFAAADRHYTQALSLLENARLSLGGLTEAKVGYLEKEIAAYQGYIRLLLKTGQNAKAFTWTQKAKARALLDLMESGHVNITQAMSRKDREQETSLIKRGKELSQQWLAAMSEVEELKQQPQPDQNRQAQARAQADSVQRQQQQLEREWRAFHDRMYLQNPGIAQQRAARTLTLEEAAASLPADTALLEYSLLKTGQGAGGRDEIVLFVVTQEGERPRLKVFRTKTVESLARIASEFWKACEGRPHSRVESPYKDLSRRLYRLLIAPAESAIVSKKRLIVCPDGPLWDVPFHALIAPGTPSRKPQPRRTQSTFLWERFTLAYGYSATGTKAALDAHARPNRLRPRNTMLVLANPNTGLDGRISTASARAVGEAGSGETSRGLYLRSGGLGALPYTRIEANAILSTFPKATLRMGNEAQETLIKETGANFRYLHFATHALVNDAAPMLSGVVLARPAKDSSEDGILTVRELFDMNLAADMIVFSACETAQGARKQGEGRIGLAWAAFVAGVPAQVVSLWSVDDEATAQLMKGFYRGLKQGQPKDRALRNAALSLLLDGKHSHPFYWAPFLVIGDWR
jgi:CHAT domain-containing protein/tetratricopeptide (TPR) repeat protein